MIRLNQVTYAEVRRTCSSGLAVYCLWGMLFGLGTLVVHILEVNCRNSRPLGLVPKDLRLGHLDVSQNYRSAGRRLRSLGSSRGLQTLSQPRLFFLLLPLRPEHNSDDARVETEENGVESAHKSSSDSCSKGNRGRDVDIWSPSYDKIHNNAREDADDWYTNVP